MDNFSQDKFKNANQPVKVMSSQGRIGPTILLSIISLIFLSSSLYFYFQNRQLQTRLSDLESKIFVNPLQPQTPPPSDIVTLPTPTAIPASLSKINWESFSTPIYKLFYPDTWTKQEVSTGIILSKGTSTITISGLRSFFACDKEIIQGYPKDTLFWVIEEISASSQYQVCEYTEHNPIPNTYIGSIILKGKNIDTQTLDEFKYIMEKIQIIIPDGLVYKCPVNGWVDCQPVMDEAKKKACSSEAMAWYKTNCPNFQGGAL